MQIHYLINEQTFQTGLALCNCRQTRSTGVGISPGPSRPKHGGQGVLMSVDIRGGVML